MKAITRRIACFLRNPMAVALVTEFLILLYLLRPLLWSAYSGDDVFFSQGPMRRAFSGQGLLNDVASQNDYWIDTYGRFFPVTILQTQLVFELFRTRLSYKVIQLLFAVAAWLAVVTFVRLSTRSSHHAVFAGAVGLFAFQFRFFHDPLLQFSAQQPFLVIEVFVSLSTLVLAGRAVQGSHFRRLTLVAAAVWTLGLLTYETTFLLTVVPMAYIARRFGRGRRRFALLAFALPAAVLGVAVAYLRSLVVTTAPAYTLSFDPVDTGRVLLQQVTGVLPFSYQTLSPTAGIPTVLSGWFVSGIGDSLILLLSLGLVILFWRWYRPSTIPAPERMLLLFAGWSFLLVPSAVIAVTHRWQMGEVDWGLPYVSVFFSATGLILLAVVLTARPVRTAGTRTGVATYLRRPISTAVSFIGAISILLGPHIIADTNSWVVERFSVLRTDREAFVEEIEAGVFDTIPPGSVVITDAASSWFWVNGPFVAWYGGPGELSFVVPDDPIIEACGEAQLCYKYSGDTAPAVSPFTADR